MTRRERRLCSMGIEYGEGHPLSVAAVSHLMRRLGLPSGSAIRIRAGQVIVNGRVIASVGRIERDAKEQPPF